VLQCDLLYSNTGKADMAVGPKQEERHCGIRSRANTAPLASPGIS
jgi:hypothetical protein